MRLLTVEEGLSLTPMSALETLFLWLEYLFLPASCLVMLYCHLFKDCVYFFFLWKGNCKGSGSGEDGNGEKLGREGDGKLWLGCIAWEKNVFNKNIKKRILIWNKFAAIFVCIWVCVPVCVYMIVFMYANEEDNTCSLLPLSTYFTEIRSLSETGPHYFVLLSISLFSLRSQPRE